MSSETFHKAASQNSYAGRAESRYSLLRNELATVKKMTPIRENDRVFISEMLFYIRNKLATTPKNIIIENCVRFYSVEEISSEKEKFENAFNVRLSRRHNNDDYGSKTLGDIIDKMLAVDNADESSPKFVARDLMRVPSVTSDANSFVSLDMLLASMHDMKSTIRKMQSEMVTKQSLETCLNKRNDALENQQNIASRNSDIVDTGVDVDASTAGAAAAAPAAVTRSSEVEKAAERVAALASSPETADIESWNDVVQRKTSKPVPRSSSDKNPRQRPSSRKPSPVIIGTSVSAGRISLKGADLTVAKYIGYLENSTRPEDIRALLDEHGVEIVSLDPIPQKHDRFKSYKLVVKKNQLPIVEDEKIWPEGVLVGRFWSPKSNNSSSSAPPNE